LPSGNSESLEAEEARGILLCHHVDLGLAEARSCKDRHGHLKRLGVVHSARLTEVSADHDIGRTERANVGYLLRAVIHYRILRIDDLGSSTREALTAEDDL